MGAIRKTKNTPRPRFRGVLYQNGDAVSSHNIHQAEAHNATHSGLPLCLSLFGVSKADTHKSFWGL